MPDSGNSPNWQEIADATNTARQTIDDWVKGFADLASDAKSANWQSFDPPIYNVWKQQPHSNTK